MKGLHYGQACISGREVQVCSQCLFLDYFEEECHHWNTANHNKFRLFFYYGMRNDISLHVI